MYCAVSVRKVSLVLWVLAVFGCTPASAQEPAPLLAAATIDIAPPQSPLPSITSEAIPPEAVRAAQARRPRAMVPLYAAFASLQVLDVHSTTRALDRGAIEMNPLMKGIAGNPAGMLAIKAGATTGLVYAGERLWKRNRTAAVLFMVAANSAIGWVVQHNYRAVR